MGSRRGRLSEVKHCSVARCLPDFCHPKKTRVRSNPGISSRLVALKSSNWVHCARQLMGYVRAI